MKRQRYIIGVSLREGVISDQFRALAQELVKRGHSVTFLTWGGKSIEEDSNSSIPTYSWPSTRPTGIRDLIFLFKFIRKLKPHCLIANFGAVNLMMVMGWLMRVPCRIAWYHTLSSQLMADSRRPQRLIKLLMLRKRLVYKLCTQIIANSRAAAQDVQQAYKVAADRCKVLYYSMKDPLLSLGSGETPKKKYLIACTGRLYPSKGQDTLIRAASKLKPEFKDLRVIFIGDGPSKTEYVRLAEGLGISENCMFIGSVPHPEVLKHVQEAAVAVVPSRNEAFGIVTIESLAVGTPVVASQVGGISEIVRDAVDGFLVQPTEDEAFSQRIKILLTDELLYQRMSRNARQRFLDEFEQSKSILKEASWFEEIVNKSRGIKLEQGYIQNS